VRFILNRISHVGAAARPDGDLRHSGKLKTIAPTTIPAAHSVQYCGFFHTKMPIVIAAAKTISTGRISAMRTT